MTFAARELCTIRDQNPALLLIPNTLPIGANPALAVRFSGPGRRQTCQTARSSVPTLAKPAGTEPPTSAQVAQR